MDLTNLSTEDLRRLVERANTELTERDKALSFRELNSVCRAIDKVIRDASTNWFDTLGINRPMFRDRDNHSNLWAGVKGRTPSWVPTNALDVLVQQAVMGPKDLDTIRKLCTMYGENRSNAELIDLLSDAGMDGTTVQNYVNAWRIA